DEELHGPVAGVERRVEAALGDVDRAARPDLAGHRVAVLVFDHLLALAGDDEDDLLGAGLVVTGMALTRLDVDHAAGEASGAVDLRRDGQGKLAPVEAEG